MEEDDEEDDDDNEIQEMKAKFNQILANFDNDRNVNRDSGQQRALTTGGSSS